jgi:hypothetical protein
MAACGSATATAATESPSGRSADATALAMRSQRSQPRTPAMVKRPRRSCVGAGDCVDRSAAGDAKLCTVAGRRPAVGVAPRNVASAGRPIAAAIAFRSGAARNGAAGVAREVADGGLGDAR